MKSEVSVLANYYALTLEYWTLITMILTLDHLISPVELSL